MKRGLILICLLICCLLSSCASKPKKSYLYSKDTKYGHIYLDKIDDYYVLSILEIDQFSDNYMYNFDIKSKSQKKINELLVYILEHDFNNYYATIVCGLEVLRPDLTLIHQNYIPRKNYIIDDRLFLLE